MLAEDNRKLDGLNGEASGGEVDWDIGIDSNDQAEGDEDINWDIDVGEEPPKATKEENDAKSSTEPINAGKQRTHLCCH